VVDDGLDDSEELLDFWGTTVMVDGAADVLEEEDGEEDEDLLEVVDDAVVGTTSFPPVMVTACPPKSVPLLVKVVVAVAAVEVIVPRVAARDLLHSPWSAVILHPTSTVRSGSSEAVGLWE